MKEQTILLVEDNPDDAELVLRTMKKQELHYNAVVARDGSEALDYIFCAGMYDGRENCIPPALIMMDIRLPKISGLEVLRKVRNHNPTKLLPVVMLTSSDEEHDLIESYTLGANSYIRKPVNYHRFQAVVNQLIQYWLIWNEVPSSFCE